MIGSAICITIYLVLLIISFIFKLKKKDTKIIKKIFLGAFFCEVIFAGVMIFCNVDDANSYYFDQKKEMTTQKNTLYNLTDEYVETRGRYYITQLNKNSIQY